MGRILGGDVIGGLETSRLRTFIVFCPKFVGKQRNCNLPVKENARWPIASNLFDKVQHDDTIPRLVPYRL